MQLGWHARWGENSVENFVVRRSRMRCSDSTGVEIKEKYIAKISIKWLSERSDQGTGLMTLESSSIPGEDISLLSSASKLSLKPIQPPVLWVLVTVWHEVKQPEWKGSHSSPSVAIS
jgi:hypothetical protein